MLYNSDDGRWFEGDEMSGYERYLASRPTMGEGVEHQGNDSSSNVQTQREAKQQEFAWAYSNMSPSQRILCDQYNAALDAASRSFHATIATNTSLSAKVDVTTTFYTYTQMAAPAGSKLDAYVWKADLMALSVAGHFMVTEHNSTNVLVSQFPTKKDGTEGVFSILSMNPQGINKKFNYEETFREEKRLPDGVFTVEVGDYNAALKQAALERAKTTWAASPSGPNQTQCSVAGLNVLNAGGANIVVPGYSGGTLMPGSLYCATNLIIGIF
jgi:hypothetical protein